MTFLKCMSINLFVTLTEEEPRFVREVEEDGLSEEQEPISDEPAEGASKTFFPIDS